MISPEPVVCPTPGTTEEAISRTRHFLDDRSPGPRIDRQFRRVADAIAAEFPLPRGGTITFSGVGSDSHVADVSMNVARQLALHPGASVVLVDGDAESRLLTERSAAAASDGLAEVLQQQTSISSVLEPTPIGNVRFLPFGDSRKALNPIAPDKVRATLADLRQAACYTVIAAGTGTGSLHAILSRHSDGTYLVVQLGVASHQDTSGLARFLSRAGARLLGCVATSVV
jgi:Mrp family chromosome partitioning ATPase